MLASFSGMAKNGKKFLQRVWKIIERRKVFLIFVDIENMRSSLARIMSYIMVS